MFRVLTHDNLDLDCWGSPSPREGGGDPYSSFCYCIRRLGGLGLNSEMRKFLKDPLLYPRTIPLPARQKFAAHARSIAVLRQKQLRERMQAGTPAVPTDTPGTQQLQVTVSRYSFLI